MRTSSRRHSRCPRDPALLVREPVIERGVGCPVHGGRRALLSLPFPLTGRGYSRKTRASTQNPPMPRGVPNLGRDLEEALPGDCMSDHIPSISGVLVPARKDGGPPGFCSRHSAQEGTAEDSRPFGVDCDGTTPIPADSSFEKASERGAGRRIVVATLSDPAPGEGPRLLPRITPRSTAPSSRPCIGPGRPSCGCRVWAGSGRESRGLRSRRPPR